MIYPPLSIASGIRHACSILLALSLSWICAAQTNYLDNETLYQNQDPNTETRRSAHFRFCFGHFNRDTGTPMTEQLAQGNLQMFEQMWTRWVVEMGMHDINESVTEPDGNKYRANFNVLMTWNDGGGGGAFSSMDGNGFFYAMANSGYCRFDPPSGATPHEFGHVWEGSAAGFNGSDSSGAWWECTANWMQLQFLNTYPQAGGYVANGMYYPCHGRDYYDSWTIWEAAHDDPRYGALWVNNVWTNANASQRTSEFIIDRMIRCDNSGSPDKAGALKDLWGDMAKKMITWDFQRQRWLATANSADDGSDWYYYQRSRTPLVKMPGTNGWFRPARSHAPMEFGFNFIPLTATPGATVTCDFQPDCDPVRQSDWRACLVAVSTNNDARYSALWNKGAQTMKLSADESKLYLVVIATPKPMKIADPAWKAYLTDAGLQFPYRASFTGTAPRNVIYPVQSRTNMRQHANGGGWVANTATVDATAFVGPNAQVLNTAQVRNYARVEDWAVVRSSAQVRDNAVVSGHAMVQDNAKVYGNAKVRDWARVFGYAEVYENAKVIEHANCGDGNATTHTKAYGNAVVKGTTYVYDTSTFAGGIIVDGDTANGNGTTAATYGVHFGWSWGADAARFTGLTNNNFIYAQHSFEKDNAVFALDQYGINHGFLMNGCRVEKDTNAPTRGGRVLPLDGVSEYVELHNSVNDFKDTAVAVWLKWTDGAADQRLWSFGDGAGKTMHLTPNDSTTGGLRLVATDGVVTESLNGGALAANTWTHVTVVFSGTASNAILYVNGAPVATNSAITLFPDSLNAPLMENANYLGRGNAGNYFQGCLDDFRVYMKSLNAAEVAAIYSAAAPAPVTITADTTAPTPNAATWLVSPTALSDSAVTMSATPGADASGWVEYYFACTAGGGHDSGWVSFNKYTDVGLTPGTAYSYTVRMRDRNGNTTASSTAGNVTTPTSSVGAASFAYGPVGISSSAITMTATKGTNTTGHTEYLFSRSGKSSGWQASPTWTDTSLTSGSSYTYTVQMRDGRGNVGAASSGVTAAARDQAAPILPRDYAQWAMRPYATIDNKVSMTAQSPTTSDASGLQYYFRCTSSNAPDSGWQTSATYLTPALADGTYTFEYKVRDRSASNESPASVSYSATITPTTGYHPYSLSQVLTNPDDYLVTFTATVMKVNSNSYSVKDLASGATINVKSSTSNEVTYASNALKNVTFKGHLYTLGGQRIVTFATLSPAGAPPLYAITGRVTNNVGAGIAGATVYFADAPVASSNAIVTAITDATGFYSNGVTPGTWYLAAGASAFNTSTDRVVVVTNASVTNVNFGLVANAVVSGKVTRVSDGAAVAGASVWFSRSPGPSANPVFTATTDVNGNYSRSVQDGVWYVGAGASGFYTSPDKLVTVAGVNVGGIHFALKANARNIPATSNLLFSALIDAFPASGNTGPWASYLPAAQNFATMGVPTVEVVNGVKWENNVYGDGDGFRQGTYSSPVPIEGATIVVAARPKRNTSGTSWTSIVDLMYNRLVLGIRNSTGKIDVSRNGSWSSSSATIPDRQPTILSLVVQSNGQYRVFANGAQVMNITTTSDMTSLVPNVAGGYANAFNIGRNDPDGWSTFNGNIGDVFVYKVALSDAERQQLEADLTTKFLVTDYTITASAGAGGYINPGGTVFVPPGGTQSFSISALEGYAVTNVLVDGVSVGAVSSYTFTNVTTNHTISAAFGPADFTVTLTSPVEGATFNSPAPVTLAATAYSPSGSVTNIEFFADESSLGADATAPYTLTTTNLAIGSHALWAVAANDAGQRATSAVVQITVLPPVFITLISTGSVWKYFDRTNDLGTAWRAPSYNDSSWSNGLAQLGYGDGDEATQVVSNRARITTYFRRAFDVPTNSLFFSAVVRVLRDDGAVGYLNGVEIFRSNMPTNVPIGWATQAVAAATGGDETTNFYSYIVSTAPLQPGANVMAVEVHQNGTASTDLSFDLALFATNVSAQFNTPPTTSAVADQTIAEDMPLLLLPLTIGDAESPLNTLVVSASAADTNLVPTLALTGSGSNQFLSLWPAPDANGTTTITITAGDGFATATNRFQLTVTSANDPPVVTLTNPTNGATLPPGAFTLAATAGDVDDAIARVEFYLDGAKVGEDTNAPFAAALASLPGGYHSFAALATDTGGASKWSTPARVTINWAPLNLVTNGSDWKYNDLGLNLGTGWVAPDYDDSLWPAGPAPLGYGDANGIAPRTTNFWGTNTANKFITTYYRCTFLVPDVPAWSLATVSIRRDDGAIVYLNGEEIFRSNMTNAAVDYLTRALSTVSGAAESTWYSNAVNASRFLAGTNTLAVEIHQDRPDSSDIFFDLRLTAQPTNLTPRIEIVPGASTFALQWPAWAAGIVLESATDLTPPVAWQAGRFEGFLTNGHWTVTPAASETGNFFRLRSP